VGKSTAALVLSQVYCAAGKATALIDADPNQPLATWAKRSAEAIPKNLTVIGGINEQTIIDTIEDAAAKNTFVIVDLEGSANMTATYAVSRADLVLIPMRGKQLDADQAGRVVAFIKQQNKAFGRDIAYRAMFSMMDQLTSREERHIRAMLAENGIPILPAALKNMAAFSAIFQTGGTIFDLTKEDVTNTSKAIQNAGELAQAVAAAIPTKRAKVA
jgi:chromosome partitioning protein